MPTGFLKDVGRSLLASGPALLTGNWVQAGLIFGTTLAQQQLADDAPERMLSQHFFNRLLAKEFFKDYAYGYLRVPCQLAWFGQQLVAGGDATLRNAGVNVPNREHDVADLALYLSSGEIDRVVALLFDDEPILLAPDSAAASGALVPVARDLRGFLAVHPYFATGLTGGPEDLGRRYGADNASDVRWVNYDPGAPDAPIEHLPDKSYLHGQMFFNTDDSTDHTNYWGQEDTPFPSEIAAVCYGVKVPDLARYPNHEATTVWTNNAVAIYYHVCRNLLGYAPEDLNMESFLEGYNYAGVVLENDYDEYNTPESAPLSGSDRAAFFENWPTHSLTYPYNGIVSSNDAPTRIRERFETAIRGQITDEGGKVTIRVGKYRRPMALTHSITDRDWIGQPKQRSQQPVAQQYNQITLTYQSQPDNFREKTRTIQDAAAIAENDGQVLPYAQTLVVEHTSDDMTAERLGLAMLLSSRTYQQVQGHVGGLVRYQRGDSVYVSSSALEIEAGVYRLLEKRFEVEQNRTWVLLERHIPEQYRNATTLPPYQDTLRTFRRPGVLVTPPPLPAEVVLTGIDRGFVLERNSAGLDAGDYAYTEVMITGGDVNARERITSSRHTFGGLANAGDTITFDVTVTDVDRFGNRSQSTRDTVTTVDATMLSATAFSIGRRFRYNDYWLPTTPAEAWSAGKYAFLQGNQVNAITNQTFDLVGTDDGADEVLFFPTGAGANASMLDTFLETFNASELTETADPRAPIVGTHVRAYVSDRYWAAYRIRGVRKVDPFLSNVPDTGVVVSVLRVASRLEPGAAPPFGAAPDAPAIFWDFEATIGERGPAGADGASGDTTEFRYALHPRGEVPPLPFATSPYRPADPVRVQLPGGRAADWLLDPPNPEIRVDASTDLPVRWIPYVIQRVIPDAPKAGDTPPTAEEVDSGVAPWGDWTAPVDFVMAAEDGGSFEYAYFRNATGRLPTRPVASNIYVYDDDAWRLVTVAEYQADGFFPGDHNDTEYEVRATPTVVADEESQGEWARNQSDLELSPSLGRYLFGVARWRDKDGIAGPYSEPYRVAVVPQPVEEFFVVLPPGTKTYVVGLDYDAAGGIYTNVPRYDESTQTWVNVSQTITLPAPLRPGYQTGDGRTAEHTLPTAPVTLPGQVDALNEIWYRVPGVTGRHQYQKAVWFFHEIDESLQNLFALWGFQSWCTRRTWSEDTHRWSALSEAIVCGTIDQRPPDEDPDAIWVLTYQQGEEVWINLNRQMETSSGQETAPTAPRSLAASNTFARGTTLRWQGPTGGGAPTGYDIERLDGMAGTTVNWRRTYDTTLTQAITGLTPDTTYRFRVKARRGTAVGPASNTVTVTTTAVPVLTLSAFSPTTISLGRTDVAVPATGTYTLQRKKSTDPDTAWANRTTAMGTSYSDVGLEDDTTYNYRVKKGTGAYSDVLVASTGVSRIGSIPTLVLSGAMQDGFLAMWSRVRGTGTFELRISGPGITGERGIFLGRRQWRTRRLRPNSVYSARVRLGTAPWSDTETIRTAHSPPNVTVTSTPLSATQSTVTVAFAGGSVMSGTYTGEYKKATEATWTPIPGGAIAASPFTFAVDQGTEYNFRVRRGTGPYGEATHTTAVPTPDLSVAATYNTIKADWAPGVPTGTWMLRWKRAAQTVYPSENLFTSETATTHTITGLQVNTEYNVQIERGGVSRTRNATTPFQTPTLSTTGTVKFNGATLSWTAVSQPVGAYSLERALGSGAFVEVVGQGTTTYNDTALVASTRYRYRVRKGTGPYSNIVTLTTPAFVATAPTITSVVWVENAVEFFGRRRGAYRIRWTPGDGVGTFRAFSRTSPRGQFTADHQPYPDTQREAFLFGLFGPIGSAQVEVYMQQGTGPQSATVTATRPSA